MNQLVISSNSKWFKVILSNYQVRKITKLIKKSMNKLVISSSFK